MGTLDDTIFLIRGQQMDVVARHTAAALEAAGARRIVAVMDERAGPADTAPYPKVSIGADTPAALGLPILPEHWGWFCGDICYYAARQVYPDAAYYCLIESDVAMPGQSASAFLKGLDGVDADLLAVDLGPKDEPQRFSRQLTRLHLDPTWGCILPVTRASAAAVKVMHKLRRVSSRRGFQRLNDEGVLCGAAQHPDLSFLSLDEIMPDVFGHEDFNTNPPHLAEAILPRVRTSQAIHPVVTLVNVLERIAKGNKNYFPYRLRKILEEASPDQQEAIASALRDVDAKRESETD
ncbi:hypothetical protein [Falsirhodobacter algicola]|uniref:Uncharacterized protein n=1 Tax=Falsirhodobacter algicola TaxID=2692330 RepID=A0A8J8MRI2_9RHOB|nr:hypothetical protein [Falsirhodobacter algicola]QUS35046.1 hypothetical protein GR316_01400 [Falsirhodobacter algicola]